MATINNLVKFAAKFLNMAKGKGKDKKKAVAKAKPAKTKSKPVAKKVSNPVKKAPAKAKKIVKPIAKKVVKAKPVAKKVAKVKPVAKKKAVVKAKAKPVAKKITKVKPVAKKVVKKAVKKPVVKAKPVIKKVVKPAKPVKKEKIVKAAVPVKPQKPAKKGAVQQIVKNEVTPFAKQLYKPQPLPQPVPVKTNNKKKYMDDLNLRYSDKELKEFKDLIDNKLVSARDELNNLRESLHNHTESQAGNKAWNMEEGTDNSEMEYLMNQISRQHGYIRNLELALVRVENKTYGVCRVTSKLIPKERLRVVPHATLSLEAKNNRRADDEAPAAATTAAPPTDFAEGFED